MIIPRESKKETQWRPTQFNGHFLGKFWLAGCQQKAKEKYMVYPVMKAQSL